MSKSKPDQPPFILVDGTSYLYRAFHALPPLTSATGMPTGAIVGVTNMLLKLLREYDPERLAVVFDAKGKTFRDELYAEYKAHRPPMPDELRSQLPVLIDIVTALGLPLLRIPGVEADDVIGTLATQAKAAGMNTVVSTIDKDMAQLVDKGITLIDTMFDRVMDRERVNKKFGVEPGQMIDYLALVGDSSDNIPGVPGVGPKTASALLGHFPHIDAIYANLDDVANVTVRGAAKLGAKLEKHYDDVVLSRKLATIVTDVELDVKPADLLRTEPDERALREIYSRLDMNSLLRQLPKAPDKAPPSELVHGDYETVFTKTALSKMISTLKKAKLLVIDTETTSLNYMDAEIVGLSFCVEPGKAWYVPVAHDYPAAPKQLDRAAVLESLRELIEDETQAKLGHHLKYDAHVLMNYGISLRGMRFDTMLESYIINSTAGRHDMDSLAARYLERKTIKFEDVAGKGAKQLTFNDVPIEQAAPYAAEDADITLQLHRKIWPRLRALPELEELYTTIEQPLVPVLQAMEYTGVLIDKKMLNDLSDEFRERMADIEQQAHKEAGAPFNLESPKQLQEILFERLGLPVLRRTPKRQPSTAEDVLLELAEDYPLPQLILDYRALSKLLSTYADKLPLQVNERTGRVHTSYHQAVAATGRLSSSDPNLQNIPIRTPEGRRIRQAFIPPKGTVLLAADYSQIELRIMAHLSGDEGLLAAFAEDRDVHQATASEVFGVALDKVDADQRRAAKAINFGLIYGMSAFGLAKQLGIERRDAQNYVDLYFERYPGVRRYMDQTRERAREQGYVETVFGRRLYLNDIQSRNAPRRQYAERSAINAPMQGTAADIIKQAMIAVHDWLRSANNGARLIMQVHDELVLEVPKKRLTEVRDGLVQLMSGAADLQVPLKVDTGSGDNWDEAH
ncbi:MAG: DNA polymerase I [Gammaproteobacteria bacterium]|nr:DNA polymerase I [Gammaproteobacteria bacterium]MDH3767131.1 DNA polymerase I [Gammaproteobacteria bacterium]